MPIDSEDERAFWQGFIDDVEFDHPEQSAPRHGGQGWVKIPMPEPIGWMTAYRTAKGTGGLFLRLKGDEGKIIYDELKAAQERLENEIGLSFNEQDRKDDSFEVLIELPYRGNPHDDENYQKWLREYANKAVSALRPFLAQFS